MQVKKTQILYLKVPLPLLPGSLSTAASTCGKANCACKAHPPKLHGIYFRWTGFLDGKRTTKTLTKAQAQECRRRIQNYRRFQRQIQKVLSNSMAKAPWKTAK
jgi:Family of unknown function (DUF6788)